MTRTEPVLSIGGITAAITAILTLLVEFGVPITTGQADAIQAAILAVGAIVAAVLIRRGVWSPASHDDEVERARLEPTPPVEG